MTEFYFNSQKVTEDELQQMMNAAQDAIIEESERVQKEYGVRPQTADAVVYLRSRSRWTFAKERELIERDHAHNPIPLRDVLSGEF